MSAAISIAADDGSIYRAHREAYLGQLVAPMDDMWAAFVEGSSHYVLQIDGAPAGSCAIDAEKRLLRFHVESGQRGRSAELLRRVREELTPDCAMAFSLDPHGLSTMLGLAARVEPHTLLYGPHGEPSSPGLEGLRSGEARDHGPVVDFQQAAIGAPSAFLEPYTRERLDRRELWLHEQDKRLLAVGELRRDDRQPGIAHLGVIVDREARGKGLATAMLSSLVRLCREEGLTPHCSTELGNVGAQRAIERAGFRADHRLFRVELSG